MIDLGNYKATDFNNLVLSLSIIMSITGLGLFGYWMQNYSSTAGTLTEISEFLEPKNAYYISGLVLISLGIFGIFVNTIITHEDDEIKNR
jgi:hypothetical protein